MADQKLYRHAKPHHEILRRYRHYASQSRFRVSAILSIIAFFTSALVIQPLAIDFATERASNPVTDVVLSNIARVNVDAFFVYGMFLLVAFVTLLCLAHPKRLPFTLFALSLFVLVRCVFVSLTHIAPFIPAPPSGFSPGITKAFFGGDLFFSGHTGSPFLLALIYWREVGLRNLFLLWSAFFGVIVLLGHHHYSIDVLAAFFITYGIFHMALWLFPTEWSFFNSDMPEKERASRVP